MTNVRAVDVGSPEALQSKALLLDCFHVDLGDQGQVDHFGSYVDTANVIAVTANPGNSSEVTGTALLSRDANPGEFRIDYVAVAEKARGKGLASALIGFCETQAVALGAQKILIDSTVGNGHKLYVGLGYQTNSTPADVASKNEIPFFKVL